jgi:preprotein translocase subunit YajC
MFSTPAYAQAAGAAGQAGGTAGAIISFAPLILIFVAFYFLMIRPQQKRMKTLQTAISDMKKGDQVVTAGGLLGKVVKVDDKYVELELGPNVKVRAVKATIAEVVSAGAGKPAND